MEFISGVEVGCFQTFGAEIYRSCLKVYSFLFLFRYEENNNNCYDFALSFLNQLLPTNTEPLRKADFCKDFIVPRTTKAACYIDLYRRVHQVGGVSVERIQR